MVGTEYRTADNAIAYIIHETLRDDKIVQTPENMKNQFQNNPKKTQTLILTIQYFFLEHSSNKSKKCKHPYRSDRNS